MAFPVGWCCCQSFPPGRRPRCALCGQDINASADRRKEFRLITISHEKKQEASCVQSNLNFRHRYVLMLSRSVGLCGRLLLLSLRLSVNVEDERVSCKRQPYPFLYSATLGFIFTPPPPQGALGAARRYAEDLERGRVRVAEAERERLRARGATETLLERVDSLARKAEEEAAQVFRFGHVEACVCASADQFA